MAKLPRAMPNQVFSIRITARKLVRLAKREEVDTIEVIRIIRDWLEKDVKDLEKFYWGREEE